VCHHQNRGQAERDRPRPDGVAGGIGKRLEIDPVVVRLGFVLLTFAGGIGLLLYAAAALVSRKPDPDNPPPPPKTSTRQAVAIALVLTGVLLAFRGVGLWFGDGIVWPVALVALGSAVIWTRGDEATRAKWLARTETRLDEMVRRVTELRRPHDAHAHALLIKVRVGWMG